MKFLHKGKLHQENSRRGGMLILVLMIFAVSLILISSAMTITLASRNRYYVDTERSQERLTLSCAAETVIDAIEAQEITDAQLKTMAATNGTTQYKITGASGSKLGSSPSSNSGKAIAPGLAASGKTNETYFTVKKAATGSNDVIVEFATIIDVTGSDKNYERLRVYLEYTEDEGSPEICANMVTAGDDSSSAVMNVQDILVNTTKSYTVFHGNVEMSSSSQTYVANTAVITGTFKGGNGTRFMGDVIFYGPKATIDAGSGGNGLSVANGSNVYFIGVPYGENDGKLNVFSNGTPGDGFNLQSNGLYFYNAKFDPVGSEQGNSQNFQATSGPGSVFSSYGGNVYMGRYWYVDDSSNVSRSKNNSGATNYIYNNGATVSVPNETNIHVYTATNKPTANSAEDKAFKELSEKGQKYRSDAALEKAAKQQVPSTTAQFNSFGSYASKASAGKINKTGNSTLQGGKHYIMEAGEYSNGECYIELADGDASIYVKGDVSLSNFKIRVSNTSGNTLTIVLAKKAKMTFVRVAGGGIISCDDRYNALGTDPWNNDLRAKSGQKPAAIIAGLGQNTITIPCPNIMDAYVSLAGTGSEAGTFIFGGQAGSKPMAFYGRIEAAIIKNGADGQGGQMIMEYCPGINEDSSEPKPLKTCYSAKSYEYYYATA